MSARNSTAGPLPLRSTPATPVVAMPSITSKPRFCSQPATIPAV